MTLHPLLKPLRDLAPEWATYVVWTSSTNCFWQDHLGSGLAFFDLLGRSRSFDAGIGAMRGVAINLRTDSIHLQQPDGTIIEVTQAEWSAMP